MKLLAVKISNWRMHYTIYNVVTNDVLNCKQVKNVTVLNYMYNGYSV